MCARANLRRITIGQSADPDDAFMAWGLASGEVRVEGARVECVFDDIETLNERALAGDLEMTALSAAAYPHVAGEYRLLRAGASFGAEYGPLVVSREPPTETGPDALDGLRIAVPGVLTTAYTLLRTSGAGEFIAVPMRFDEIIEAVCAGSVDAGLIIHEGQLTFADYGLHALFEPARAWHEQLGLPVPLGVVAVKRSLGDELGDALAAAFWASIEAARAHPEEALAFAARHGRGLDEDVLRTFVDQYVDDITTDMGEAGVEALTRLYEGAVAAGLIDGVPPLDLL